MRRLTAAAAAGVVAAGAVTLAGCRHRAVTLSIPDAATTPAPLPPRLEEPTQVHFTFTGPTSVAFDWAGPARALRFWSKEAAPVTVEGRVAAPAPFSSEGPFHEAELTGLTPGAEYGYVIGNPEDPVRSTFRAPPPPGPADFTFVAVGDVGASNDRPDVRVVHRLVTLADPAFVLLLGDLTYGDEGSQRSVDQHFEDAMAWSRRAAYMPAWGNHEWADAKKDDLRNYKGRFALPHGQASPGAPAAGCCGEDWSWFDYAHVRFVSHPEPYSSATLVDWEAKAGPLLAEAERDPALRFVVTYGHRAAYSSGKHGGDPQLRGVLERFGAKFGKYVLDLGAHDHVYERAQPRGHVVHVTAGIGGSPLERADTPCGFPDCKRPAWSAFRALRHGIVKVVARGDQLRVEAICGPPSPGIDTVRCVDGEIFDSVKIGVGGQIVLR